MEDFHALTKNDIKKNDIIDVIK